MAIRHEGANGKLTLRQANENAILVFFENMQGVLDQLNAELDRVLMEGGSIYGTLSEKANNIINIMIEEVSFNQLWDDPQVVLEVLKYDRLGLSLEYIPEELRDDKDFMMQAVKYNCRTLTVASERLRGFDGAYLQDAKDLVIESFKNGRACLEVDSKYNPYMDTEPICHVHKVPRNELSFVSSALRDDREVVLEAVSRSGYPLFQASERLKADRELVLVAASKCGSVLQCVNEKFRDDTEVVVAAVANDPYAIAYASDRLKGFEPTSYKDAGKVLAAAGTNDRISREDYRYWVSDVVSKGLLEHCNKDIFVEKAQTKIKIVLQAAKANAVRIAHLIKDKFHSKGGKSPEM